MGHGPQGGGGGRQGHHYRSRQHLVGRHVRGQEEVQGAEGGGRRVQESGGECRGQGNANVIVIARDNTSSDDMPEEVSVGRRLQQRKGGCREGSGLEMKVYEGAVG